MGIILLVEAVGTIYWPSFTWSPNHWGITIQPVSALTLEMELTSLPTGRGQEDHANSTFSP